VKIRDGPAAVIGDKGFTNATFNIEIDGKAKAVRMIQESEDLPGMFNHPSRTKGCLRILD